MRDHGSGTVSKRKDGRWMGKVRVGTDDLGRPRRKSVYGSSRAEVVKKMKEVRAEYESGTTVATDRRTTFAQHADLYVSATLEARVAAGTLKRSSCEWYAAMLRHGIPTLGRKRLDAITPADIERLVVSLSGLSPSTRRGVFTAVSKCLDSAVRDGLLPRNPCTALERPTVRSAEAKHLAVEEVRSLVSAAEGWMRAAVLVLAVTGLRRGELLALTWADADLDAGVLHVSATLSRTKADGLARTAAKTASSRRSVPLAPVAVQALRDHRSALSATPLPSAPVFANSTGGWMEPRNFSRAFQVAARAAGVDATPHTLRHSAATAMIASGTPLTVVSDLLGHSDIRITAGVYNHTVDAQRRAAADALGAAMGV
jgi:integrase